MSQDYWFLLLAMECLLKVEDDSFNFWRIHTSHCTLMMSKVLEYVFLSTNIGIGFCFHLNSLKSERGKNKREIICMSPFIRSWAICSVYLGLSIEVYKMNELAEGSGSN